MVRERVVIDVSAFSRFNPGRQAPVWWGMVGLILVEASVIAGFLATYFYLMMMSESWPPEGIAPPPLLLPTVSLVLMLISAGAMVWGGKLIVREKYNLFVVAMFTAVGLAFTVLALRWHQFQNFEVRWDENAYGSVVWTLMGFHFTHVVSAAIGTAVVGILGIKRYFNPQQQIGVIVDTLYWNFVALAWIPLYVTLYWVPRWL